MTYKNLYCCLIILFLPLITFGQSADSPYPINNQAYSKKTAAFIALFEDTNVGNLHVYTTKEKMPKISYFFKGQEMGSNFITMLPRKWRKMARGKKSKVYAVKNIAGADREYYIIRFLDRKSRNHLVLFELEQEDLVHKLDLAEAWCKGRRCYQKDSWIQDLDGDTRIDVVVKTLRARNSLERIDTKIYKQTRTGQFVQNNNLKIDDVKYPLEKLQ